MTMLEWLAQTPVATALQGSATLYIVVSAAHILSLGLLVGAIVPLDLRILGVARTVPLAIIGPFLQGAARTGACLAVLTGLALFSVRPVEYAANPAFLMKVGLVAAGIGNAAIHAWLATWRDAPVTPMDRVTAGLSLIFWMSAVLAGRWIGFV